MRPESRPDVTRVTLDDLSGGSVRCCGLWGFLPRKWSVEYSDERFDGSRTNPLGTRPVGRPSAVQTRHGRDRTVLPSPGSLPSDQCRARFFGARDTSGGGYGRTR